ncbi:MAG: elongation factor P [Candidatus Babeliales bacterium]
MIATTDFRKGVKILYDNEPYIVIAYHHVKPGKGGAFVKTKMKNMITGFVREETFRSGEKFPEPDLQYLKMQYLYTDGDLYYFMDQENFDQVAFNREQLIDAFDYLKEQEIYTILYFNKKPITVMPPMFIELMVATTPPGVKGDTAQGAGTKPATLETGLVVQVPLFVEEGDYVKIDTREGTYIERVKK